MYNMLLINCNNYCVQCCLEIIKSYERNQIYDERSYMFSVAYVDQQVVDSNYNLN